MDGAHAADDAAAQLATWRLWFRRSVLGGMIVYFQMSYMLGVMGLRLRSRGGRFILRSCSVCAGAYFPIDVLPHAAQRVLLTLPFPYLVFVPLPLYI